MIKSFRQVISESENVYNKNNFTNALKKAKYSYHITSGDNYESIKKNGLKRGTYFDIVSHATTKRGLHHYFPTLRVHTQKHKMGHATDSDDYDLEHRSREAIHPRHIEVYNGRKGWEPITKSTFKAKSEDE